ncbi:MAG: phage portal protein [Bacteroidales bacterium]|nr:phage portal protein [Bacteroidales bacterium]
MVWISRKNLSALQRENSELAAEVKGYYENTENGENANRYFKALAAQLQGFDIPTAFGALNRGRLKICYETCGPVFGIVNKIAKAVGDMFPFLELQEKATGKYVEKHWVLDLLARPNDRYSTRRFGAAWAVNRLVYGDSFVYTPPSIGKDFGTCAEMYLIPGHKVGIKKGGYKAPMEGIEVTGGGVSDLIKPEEFFESFNYNLDDASFYGYSPLLAAALYLSIIDRGMKREDTSLKNGGVANIVTPAKDNLGVMPQDKDNVEEMFNKKGNVGKTLALRTPIEVHQLGNAPVDLNILESHKEAVTALCFVYDIPVDLYYGQAKYENAKEAKKALYENNAIPMANEFAADLLSHFDLAKEYTLTVNADKVDVLKDDAADVLDNLAKMHATLNEMREAYGYEPIQEDWADKPIFGMATMFGAEQFDLEEPKE